MRRTNLFYASIITLTIFSTIHAQPDTLWTKTYGTAGGEILYSIDQTADDGFIMSGVFEWGTESDDYWLVRTDAQGDTVWTRTYGGPGADQCQSGQMTADGGYIMAGLGEMWLIRTDANGDTLWTLRSGGPGGSESPHVALTNDGNYIITGNITDEVNNAQVGLVKVDDEGTILWTKKYGDVDDQFGTFVQPTADDGYIILGLKDITWPNHDFWLLKTNAAGDTAWTTVIPTDNGEPNVVRQTVDGGYAIFGLIFGTLAAPDDEAPRDWLLIKTDASGAVQWSQTYGSLGDDQSLDMIITDDGGFLLTGWSYQTDLENADLWLVKTDASGTAVWDTFVGGTGMDIGIGLAQIADGEYAVAGVTDSWGAGGYDGWLVRLGAPGETITWDGGAESSNWIDANNWSGDAVPGAGDDVVIDLDGASVTLPYGTPITVASLTLGGGSGGTETLQNPGYLNTEASRLTVAGDVTIASDGYLNLRGTAQGSGIYGDSLTAGGTITNNGMLVMNQGSKVTGNTINNGTLKTTRGYKYTLDDQNAIVGSLTNSSSGAVEIATGLESQHTSLTVTGDLTNAGKLTISTVQYLSQTGGHSADLLISGTLTNLAGGTILDTTDTFYDAVRAITVDSIDNQGTILAHGLTSYHAFGIAPATPGGAYTNSGSIHIGQRTGIYNIDNFTNTGTIAIDTAVTLTLTGFESAGTYTGSGDQFQGKGTVAFSGMVLDVAEFPPLDSLSLTLSGNSSLTLTDSLIVYSSVTATGSSITAGGVRNQGTFTIDGGGSLSSPDKAITNNGTMVLTGGSITGMMVNNDSLDVKSGTSLSAGLTNTENAKLVVTASTPQGLSVDGDLTNHGLMILKPQVSSSYTLVSVTNGSLINTITGTIQGVTGITGSSTSYLDVTLMNEGLFDNHFRISFRGDSSHTNSGIIQINQAAASMWQPHNSQLVFQNGATLTNTGTVTLDTATLSISVDGTYQGEGGTLEGTGALSLFKGTGHLGQKFVVKDAGVNLSMNASTIYVDSLINQTTLTARGNTVYAGSVIINQGKLVLEPYSSNGYYYNAWHGPFINEDTLIVEPFPQYTATHVSANEILGGPVANDTGAVMLVQSSTHGSATLTVDSSLTNHGQLTLLNDPEATSDKQVKLNVNKGWLTNSGVIDVLAYSVVKADLDNQGTFNVNPNIYLTMDKYPVERILNSGTIHVSGGDYFKVMYLDSLVITETGLLRIDAGCTAKFSGPSTSGNFPSPDADFIVLGEVWLAGNIEGTYLSIYPGSTLHIGTGQKAAFTSSRIIADSLINEGHITMTNASVLAEVVNRDTLVARIYGAAFDNTLVNEAGAIIRGEGNYSDGWTYLNVDSSFTNHGELELTTISTTAKGVRVNVGAGNLLNSSTGIIDAAVGTSTNTALEHRISAELVNQGTLAIDTAAVLAIVGSAFNNDAVGVVRGEGTLDVTAVEFTSGGAINPGGSPGILTIDGDVELQATNVINLELEGDEPGVGYDQLNVTGNAALAGSLKVSIIDPYNPAEGKTFQPLIFGTSSGVFESLTTQGGGKFLSAQFTETGVYVTASITPGGNSWPFIGGIADITVPEDTALTIVLEAFDPDAGDELSFSASSDTPAVEVEVVVDTDTLKITPELNWNGTATIEVIVSDLAGSKDTTDFALILSPVQDKPLAFNLVTPATDSTVTITAENQYSQSLVFSWNPSIDPDGNAVNYNIVLTGDLEQLPVRTIYGSDTSVYWMFQDVTSAMSSAGMSMFTGVWTIEARDQADTTDAANGPFTLNIDARAVLGVNGNGLIPEVYALHPNYPNPFNPSTTIRYDLPEAAEVMLVIYDLLGREIVQLVQDRMEAGYQQIIWNGRAANGRDVPSGIYIARMTTSEYTKSMKMVLLK
ncbi:T9SS type A sorting domain-containing protein [Candidatus Neomarinimicrobiota bacterium]